MELDSTNDSNVEDIDDQAKSEQRNQTQLFLPGVSIYETNSDVHFVLRSLTKQVSEKEEKEREEMKKKKRFKKYIKLLKQQARRNQCYVNAISNLSSLQNICSKSGLDANFDTIYSHMSSSYSSSQNKKNKLKHGDNWEVEAILDIQDSKTLGTRYLVKWKGWKSSYNSWEPLHHLTGCSQLLKEFTIIARSYNKDFRRTSICLRYILEFITSNSFKDPAPILKLCNISLNHFRGTDYHFDQLKKKLRDKCAKFFDFFNLKTKLTYYEISSKIYKDLQIEKKFGNIYNLINLVEQREDVLTELAEWEKVLNEIEAESPIGCPLIVENFVDTSGPPSDFTYITDYKIECDLTFDDDPPLWCECGSKNCYENRAQCCTSIQEAFFAYNKHGTLVLPTRRPIYECNKKCACPSDCPNRVIQKGRKYKLAIFKTDNGRGWGIRTMERIPKGKFVMEYVGEIITREEADRRDKIYSAEGKTYLFDLDFSEDKHFHYVVDSSHYGNCAHFMNHSCDPNLEVYSAWIDHYNISVPRICFFSRRDIRKGEELTFDYKMSGPQRSNELIKTDSSTRLEGEAKEGKGEKKEKFEIFNKNNSIVLDQEELEEKRNEKKVDNEDEKVTNGVNAKFYDDVNISNGNTYCEDADDLMIKSKVAKSSRILCKCGSANCRYYLF